ncbi:MAG: hypothetical protein ACQES9_08320 [Myxococcota bacterium]
MRYKRSSFIWVLFASMFLFSLACSKTGKSEDEAQVATNLENKDKTTKEQESDKKDNSKSLKLSDKKEKKETTKKKNESISKDEDPKNASIKDKKNKKDKDSSSEKTSDNNSPKPKSDQGHKKSKKNSKSKTAKAESNKDKTKQNNSKPEAGSALKIIDSGKEKKVALRYKFSSFKDTQYLKMEMITEVGVEIEDKKRPTRQAPVIQMIMKIKNQQKSRSQLTYKFSLDKVQVKETQSIPQEQHEKMVATLKKNMKNLEGIAKVNNQGRVDKIWFSKDFTYDASLNQVMNNVKNQLKNMVVPLPKDKVGIGAKWKVAKKTKMQGLELTTEYEYKLSKLNDNLAGLDVKIVQKAPKQKIQSKNMPPQFEVFLEKLVSSGKGTIEVNFNSLVPKSKIDLKMALNSLVKGGTRKMKMVMKLGIKVLISPFKK